jgi:hypothetical protein
MSSSRGFNNNAYIPLIYRVYKHLDTHRCQEANNSRYAFLLVVFLVNNKILFYV